MDIQQITSRLGLTPSPMQQAASKAILSGSGNVEVLSPTGSGKTLSTDTTEADRRWTSTAS